MPMNEAELTNIEQRLGIILPTAYREQMLARSEELKTVGGFDVPKSPIFIDPMQVILVNEDQRHPESNTTFKFRNWSRKYFLIGHDGCGFHCLRLDNMPGVWGIGDSDVPNRVRPSFESLIDHLIDERRKEAERAARGPDEIAQERAIQTEAANESRDPLAKKWVEATSPDPMFEWLRSLPKKISPRKLRLHGISCCRHHGRQSEDADCVQALAYAEQLVVGTADMIQVALLRDRMKARFLELASCKTHSPAGVFGYAAAQNLLQDDFDYLNDSPIYAGDANLMRAWLCCSNLGGDDEAHQSLADLAREIFGNPFHPVQFQDSWRTSTVTAIARRMYDSNAFDQMSELAEGLQTAGCNDSRVLAHCRRRTGHVRGCWLVDLILGNENQENPRPLSPTVT